MLRTIDLRGTELRPAQLRRVLPRGGTDVAAVVDKVAPMVHRVRQEGARRHWTTANFLMACARSTCGYRKRNWTRPSLA